MGEFRGRIILIFTSTGIKKAAGCLKQESVSSNPAVVGEGV